MLNQSTSYPHWTECYGSHIIGEAKAEEPYPRVYRHQYGTFVVKNERDCSDVFSPRNEYLHDAGWTQASCEAQECQLLPSGPEAAEYVAAAREGRDAVWPPNESDPWPHWYLDDGDDFLVRHDNEVSGECWEISGPHADGNPFATDPEETEAFHKAHGYRRIPSSEATALIAKWQAKPQPAPLPTAESVAAEAAQEIAEQSKTGPNRYEWLGTDRITKIIAAAIREDRKGRGECDDGQVTSVYNRHLQKEPV